MTAETDELIARPETAESGAMQEKRDWTELDRLHAEAAAALRDLHEKIALAVALEKKFADELASEIEGHRGRLLPQLQQGSDPHTDKVEEARASPTEDGQE